MKLLFALVVLHIRNIGKFFEIKWNESIDKKLIYCLRLKDSPISFKEYDGISFVRNNPYDNAYFYSTKGKFFALEFKTTIHPYMTIQRAKEDKNKMIKQHQIKGLAEVNQYKGAFGFFILDFKTNGITYAVNIDDFIGFLIKNNKKSISENDIKALSHIIVDKRLKKKHYRYDVKGFFDKAIALEDKYKGERI